MSERRFRAGAVPVKMVALIVAGLLVVAVGAVAIFSSSAIDLLDKDQLTPEEIRRVATELLLHEDVEVRTRASKKLAAHWDIADLLAIIPDPDRREQCRASFPSGDYAHIKDAKQRALQSKAASIEQIPRCLGGTEALAVFDSHWRDNASMYDFINVFTEYAKSLDPARRLQTEEKAGDLANWIATNKRKFL